MKEFFQGYKGSNRKFMAPVSESKFNADVMEFKDTNSNRVPFQMANKKGYLNENNLHTFNLDVWNLCIHNAVYWGINSWIFSRVWKSRTLSIWAFHALWSFGNIF